MIGTKIFKNNFDSNLYSEYAMWANENNAELVEFEEYYIVQAISNYEPTKAERIADIKKYYDTRFETLEQMVLRRRLINGDISDLQDQYKKLNLEMLAKIKAVK